MSAPSSIDLRELHDRLTPDVAPAADSSVAGADTPEHQGFIYWPNLLTRHQLTDMDLKEVRKRSQWLCLNTAARVLRRLTRYVGTSTIKPDTKDPEFNAAALKWWREDYQDIAGNYEMSGKYSSRTFLTNCLYQAWRDSDCLALHLFADDGTPTVAAIEAARIDTPLMARFNTRWQDGVLTDPYYRHLAYSISVDPPGSQRWAPLEYVTVPAGHAHFFGDFETQASTRGTPALIHAVSDLLDEREIQNAVLSTLKAHGQVGYYFSKAAGVPSGPGITQFVPPGPKRRETIEPSAPSTAAVKTAPGKRTVAELTSRADVLDLPPGWDVKTVNDGRDHPNETEIKNGIYRKLALGMGLPVEVFILLDQLTGPGVRCVLRQTQDWREYWLRQMESFQALDYTRRVEHAIRTGRLPKCKDPMFARHCFIRPRAITIDDGRTASAQVAALFAGMTNLDEIHGEKGDDWKEETTQSIEELQWILAECKRTGVPPELYFDRQKALLAPALQESPDDNARKKSDA